MTLAFRSQNRGRSTLSGYFDLHSDISSQMPTKKEKQKRIRKKYSKRKKISHAFIRKVHLLNIYLTECIVICRQVTEGKPGIKTKLR